MHLPFFLLFSLLSLLNNNNKDKIMTIIGFDIGKNELIGVRVSKTGIQQEVYCLANEKEEIIALLQELREKHRKLRVATEATGQYHRPLALACLKLDIPCWVLNPIMTKQFTRATVRKKKTDTSDALAVARLALRREGSPATQEMFNPLKKINRTNYRLGKMFQILHLMKKGLQETLPTEKKVIGKLDYLADILQISIKEIEKRIEQEIDLDLQELLCSIVGVGPAVAKTLITEIGDVQRFPDGKKLVAFSGLDPKVKQSGLTFKRNVRLTKRGSPYLRRAVFIAASVAQRHDPELKAYFEKKTAEGKTYREATCAVGRKLLHRIYAIWKRGTPYVVRA